MASQTTNRMVDLAKSPLQEPSLVYLPLREGDIRLLRLLPDCEDMVVRCELVQRHSLLKTEHNPGDSISSSQQALSAAGSTEEYESLSYTWDTELGTSPNLVPIILNGNNFLATNNLESALRHLRHDTSPRVFWIDALCIDQNNSTEKEQQVKAMHQIYDRAQQVVVWLGPECANSDLAIKFAQEIYHCFDASNQWIEDEQHFYLLSPNEISEKVKFLVVAERAATWVALHRLLSRRWWGRAWILQELLLAKRVIVCCGNLKIAWSVMSLAVSVCRATYHSILDLGITVETSNGVYRYDWPSHFIESSFDLVARRGMRIEDDPRTSSHSEALSTWLSGNRHRSCRLPHDKIYSILGLLNPAFQNAIQPSYGLTIVALYKAVVQSYVEISSRLDLICHSQHSVWQSDKPSWMPDWSRRERAAVFSEIATFELRNSPLFDSACTNFSDDLDILTVQGTCIGQIEKVELEFSMLDKLKKEWWDSSGSCTIESAKSRVDHHKVSEGGGYWYFDECARELFKPALSTIPPDHLEWDDNLNLMFEMIRLQLYPETSEWYERRKAEDDVYEPDTENLQAFFETFYANLQGLLRSRTVFETAEQEIGIAPDFTEPGDWLCMLLGCRVPVILRKRPDSSFVFVGDAYLYRSKDGDVLKELQAGRYQLQDFNLS